MSEIEAKIAVGDEVRVHFHPPGAMRSYCEGVVRRVDVTTPEGRVFVVEVTHEVLLSQEHRIRRGFPDYVRYECRKDFPGRIEVLSTADQEVETEPASDLISVEAPEAWKQEADEQHPGELAIHSGPEIEQIPEAETDSAPAQVDVEPQPARKLGGLMAALRGRRE